MNSKPLSFTTRLTAAVLIGSLAVGCKTDTQSGALIGAGGGAVIGALIDHGNPAVGALIGAAGGALTGGVIGHFMDERKKDLEKRLQPQINAGEITVEQLPGKSLKISMTGSSAFAVGYSQINPNFFPTLQTIAGVVSTYGKMTITVIGHPDMVNGVVTNTNLAYPRAEAVRTQLIAMGVSPILVSASANFGEPWADGTVQLIIIPLSSN